MLTQTAVGEYQKKISEEYNSINLNIEQLVQLTREKYCWKLWVCEPEQSFEELGCGRQERKKETVQQAQRVYIKQNESAGTVYSH